MLKFNPQNKLQSSFYRLIAATLTMGGVSLLLPLVASAQITPAGTVIRNSATGTYVDPNNPTSTLNTTSNTVTVTVAEVAGITVAGSGIADQNAGTVQPGDLLIYTYTVTNVGNAPTSFQIPNLATVTAGSATVSGLLPGAVSNGALQYSTDGGVTWLNIPAGGVTTGAIPVNGTALVRVPVTVQAGAPPLSTISVRLGQTPGDAQNQPRIADGGDVYTVDSDNTLTPVNGVREASSTQSIQVGNTAATRALATILKTRTAYNPGDLAVLNDDLISYGLSLRVENNDLTNTGVTPAALAGTPITVNTGAGAAVSNRILVSDAIPANTVLNAAPTPPIGWLVVYSTTAIGATTAETVTDWTTTAPALNTVTRVGFINDPNIVTSVAPGATVTGFNIQVRTTVATLLPTNIYNIAQVVGTTAGGGPKIYDNSGDQNPSNFNNGTVPGTFPTTTDTGFIPGGTTPPNIDTGNNNQAPNNTIGNVNQTPIAVAAANSLLNGPNGQPAAFGPTNQNDDFTNQSALIPPNLAPGSTLDPAAVSFTNTVQNTGTANTNISLVPTPPATPGDLPTNTSVTISYQGLSATYNYNGTVFTFVSGVGTVGGNPISATNPLRIDAVAANGGTASYGVSVNLPAGTPLSTDGAAQGVANVERGFPVPITAFSDTNADGLPTAGEPQNITIDRVYTGFLQLLKESRLLQGTGPAITGAQGTFSITAKTPAPGNIIEYRITYRNISSGGGSNSVLLNASSIVITEDGVIGGATGNNWALDSDNNGQIDTSNIVGSAVDSGASTITFFSGNPSTTSSGDQTGLTAATDVTRYVNTVTGTVIPGASRTFSFQRRLN
ncbi:beta strand repeat-containing protein [Pseudanabaena minima]|uniref:beta strand repeat-containing protein n=1 Tax=Pseudanabaena minima TaxID=890415 RepID=UPI003DA86B10